MKIKNIIKYLAIFLSVWVITFSIFVYFAQPNMLFRTWHNENAYNALKNYSGLVEEINVEIVMEKI